ncbi:AAEL008548-PA, partial [Aedes aegypti]
LSDCFTCMRKTDNFLRICDEANTESVDRILARHFWFEVKYELSVLCTSCWEKIDEFHKFYCEVANVHQVDALNFTKKKRGRKRKKAVEEEQEDDDEEWKPPAVDLGFPVPVHVKLEVTEPDLEEREVFAVEHQQIKRETVAAESEDDDDESEEDDEEESDEESSKPIAARRRQVKKPGRRGQSVQVSLQGMRQMLQERGWVKHAQFPIRRKTNEESVVEDDLIRKYCSLNCESCDFIGPTFSKLQVHYKNEHDAQGFAVCCARKFSKKSRLYEHVCVHENPDHFKCQVCAKTFQNSFGLSNHMMWKHTPDSEKPFRCDVCGNRFWKDYLLKQHMEYHLALEEKKYACKECDRFFGTSLLLKSHEQTVHGLSASWVCDICAKGFPLKSALEFHRQQHTQEGRAAQKAQCKYCSLWMKNVRSLRSHLKRCKSDPVSCDICGKECSNAFSLQSHKKFVHSNAPMYSCSFCAKPFKRLLRLREHEAGHTGDLLYKCEYCPRTCNSSSNMYTHKKVAHPEQWAEKVASRFHKR